MLPEVTVPYKEEFPTLELGSLLELSKFAVPWLPCHFNKKTGLVHGLVHRPHKNRIIFYLEQDNDNDHRPMFVAQRLYKSSEFYIFDVSHDRGITPAFLLNESEFISRYDKRFLGAFRQIEPERSNHIGYSIYASNSLVWGKEKPMIEVASFVYALAPLSAAAWCIGLPEFHPRQAHVAIYSEDRDASGGRGIDLFEQSMSLVRRGHLRIQDITNDRYIAQMAASDVGLNVFESTNSCCSTGDRFHVPSKKNIKVVSETYVEDIVLQMGKRSDVEFHIDFNEPFNAFQALGFALAQFEF